MICSKNKGKHSPQTVKAEKIFKTIDELLEIFDRFEYEHIRMPFDKIDILSKKREFVTVIMSIR